MLFGKEVAAVDWVAGDIRRQFAPELERAAVVDVPRRERTRTAPQHQYRTGDPAFGRAVGPVVLAVDARRGPVLLTDSVDVVGVLQLREVLRARVLVESVRRCPPLHAQRVVDDRLGRRAEEAFG